MEVVFAGQPGTDYFQTLTARMSVKNQADFDVSYVDWGRFPGINATGGWMPSTTFSPRTLPGGTIT